MRSDHTVPFDIDPLVGIAVADHYLVLQKLRTGGLGDRYLAEDLHDGRSVAIEVLHPDLFDESVLDAALASVRERGFSHPNVVEIEDCGRCGDGRAFVAMPWFEQGMDCATLLAQCGPRLIGDAVGMLEGAARGIDALHRAGRVHGDIKPANIVSVEMEGRETSLVIDSMLQLLPVKRGAIRGTPRYLAPECAHGVGVTARAEVYSFAVVLFELIAGTAPFHHDHPAYVLAAKVARPAPLLSNRTPQTVAPALDTLFACALSRDPRERPASCQMLVASLA